MHSLFCFTSKLSRPNKRTSFELSLRTQAVRGLPRVCVQPPTFFAQLGGLGDAALPKLPCTLTNRRNLSHVRRPKATS
jgi:hypothetical protein